MKDEKNLTLISETLISEVSKSVIEYIGKIILDRSKPVTIIDFNTTEINEQKVCVFGLYVPQSGFKRSFNLEIPAVWDCELYNKLLSDILDTYLKSDKLEISKFYEEVKEEQINEGIDITLDRGSKARLRFTNVSDKYLFKKIKDNYDYKLDDYQQLKSVKTRKRVIDDE